MHRPQPLAKFLRARSPAEKLYLKLYFIAFVWFFVVWAMYNYLVAPDTGAYLEMGRGALEHGVFGYKASDGLYYPNAFRMPLIPLLLASIYQFTGSDELTYFWYVLLQVFLVPLLPCLAWYWGTHVNRICAVLSYLFILFHANVIACYLFALTDIPFAVLSNFAFVAVWKASQTKSNRSFAKAGLVAGFACLVRPIMKLYPAVVAVSVLMARVRLRKGVLLWLLFTGAFLVPLLPWIARSMHMYGAPVLETNQGLNLLWSNADLVEVNPAAPEDVKAIQRHIVEHRNRPMDFVSYNGRDFWVRNDHVVSRKLQAVAVQAYKQKPAEVFRKWRQLFANNVVHQFHYDDLHEWTQPRPWFRFVRDHGPLQPQDFSEKFYHLILEAKRAMRLSYTYFAWLGLLLLLWRKPTLGGFILLNILYFTGLTSFVAGYDRYRLNLECFYGVLTATPFALLLALCVSAASSRMHPRASSEESPAS